MRGRSAKAVRHGCAFLLLLGLGVLLPQRAQTQAQTAHVNLTFGNDTHGHIGVGIFQDVNSGTENPAGTTIVFGDSVEFDWQQDGCANPPPASSFDCTHTTTTTAVPAGANTFDSGQHTWSLNDDAKVVGDAFTVTSGASGTMNKTGTYSYQCNFHGLPMTGAITVQPFGAANHFVVTPLSAPTAGSSFTLTITAEDRNNNVVTTYGTNIATVTSTAGGVGPFSNGGWSNGSQTFTLTLDTAGGQTVTFSNGSGSGTAFVTVQAGPIASFTVTVPATATTGQSANISVTGFDAFGNQAADYETLGGQGTIHFTSTDVTATVPADSLLPGGTGGFGVTFNTAGSWTVTVCDTVRTGACGTSLAVTVNPANCTAADKTFSNTSKVTVNSNQTTSPYPSTITVSGFASNQVIGKITVTLNGFDTTCQASPAFLLVGPGGQSFVLESLIGNCDFVSRTVTLTLDDSATSSLTEYICDSMCGQHAPQTSGRFKPSSYGNADPQCTRCTVPLTFVAPAPTSGFNVPSPGGSATLESVFSGTSPNGTWSLYGLAQYPNATTTLDGGWSIDITPAFQFTNPNPTNFTKTPKGASPYPSTLSVSGLQGNITKLTLTLNGLTDNACPEEVEMLLQAPSGQLFIPYYAVGNCPVSTSQSISQFVLSDSANANLPPFPTALTPGLFKPTSNAQKSFGSSNFPPTFNSPAPAGPYPLAASDGGATFASQFNGSDPNGVWNLYVLSNAPPLNPLDSGTLSSWSLQFQLACPPNSACAVTANPPGGSAFNQPVTFTASVTSGASAVTLGTVQFFDSATAISGLLPLNAAGQASITVTPPAPLVVGAHSITAQYNANFGSNTSFQPSTSPVNSYTVGQATTTAAVASSGSPVTYPASVMFTATVTPQFAGVEPTGTVTFKDGGMVLGAGTLNGLNPDTASFTTAAGALNHGTHSITATYGGDGNFTAGPTSPAINQVVNPVVTATAVSSSPNPSIFGNPVQFTATVSSGDGAPPNGSVTFAEGGVTLPGGVVAINGSGVAQVNDSALSTGTHNSITASYGGDAAGNFTSSAITLSPPQVVNQAASTATLVVTPPLSAVFGSTVTLKATVHVAPATLPTGTVTFTDGGTPIATVGITGGTNQASFSTSTLAGGSHSFAASYSGDGNYLGSSSSAQSYTIVGATSTTTVGSNINPSTFGQVVMLTANVSSTAGTPTGTVQFYSNGTVCAPPDGTLLGSGSLSAGSAGISTGAMPAGTDAIIGCYSGDTNFAASDNTASPLAQNVSPASTLTALALAPAPPKQNLARHPLTLTATVTVVAPGAGTPSGAVTFTDNGKALSTPPCTLSAGACSVTLTLGLGSVGPHTLVAIYGGNSNFTGSNSSVAPVTEYRSPKPH